MTCYLDHPNNLRYPNDPGGTAIGNGGTFTLSGFGTSRHHMTRTEFLSPKELYVVVDTSTNKTPAFGYKIFLDGQG